jgi:hypothetical protein
MVDASASPPELPVPPEAVADCCGRSVWSVSGRRWDDQRPAVPREYADLVAPPIVVGAAELSPVRVSDPAPAAAPGPGSRAPDPVRVSGSVEMLIYGPGPESGTGLVLPAPPRSVGRHRRRTRGD